MCFLSKAKRDTPFTQCKMSFSNLAAALEISELRNFGKTQIEQTPLDRASIH